jgi:hypothetical protein
MVLNLLATLEFCSNNEVHRPVLQALEVLKKYADSKLRCYPVEENIPLDGAISRVCHELVATEERVNRINYEICVLQALREKLRCKEIWVVGANRYCNVFKIGIDSYCTNLKWTLS